MPETLCCVCGQPAVRKIGRRDFCEAHYKTATYHRTGVGRSLLIQLVALAVFIGLVYLGVQVLQPVFSATSLLVTGVILAIIPAAIWLSFFYQLDRLEPDPKGYVLGVAVLGGLLAGALGGGGSILTVPVLVYLLGEEPHAASGSSLMIVGLNALVGAWLHMRDGHVKLKTALMFGASGIVAAYLGGRLSQLLPSPVLLTLFALLMILVAALMLRGTKVAPNGADKTRKAEETNGRVSDLHWPRVLAGGIAVGFLTGFLGVGGGFLIVPALVLLLSMDMRDAVGSSLIVIAINSGAGLLGHLTDSSLNWTLIAPLATGGFVGLLLGTRIANKLPAPLLRQGFAAFVILLGVTLLAINLPIVIT